MGASGSKMEEDKALQLCRERKKFVRQALDGRCSLAAAHVTYIQSLKSTGTALRRFVEPEVQVESSLYTSTNATPEPRALTESFSSPSNSQRVDATETFSPTPSPPSSSRFHVSHMKFKGFSSKKVEERPPETITATVISSTTPENTTPRANEKPESSSFEVDDSMPQEASPWDYFGLFHPIDNQFSFQEEKEPENVDSLRQLREHEGIPHLEDEDKASSLHEREESRDSDDEFDEPPTETLVRTFENLTRVSKQNAVSASPAMPSTSSVASETEHNAVSASPAIRSARSAASETEFTNGERSNSFRKVHEHNPVSLSPAIRSTRSAASETEFMNGEKTNSPHLSPLRAASSTPNGSTDVKKTPLKEDSAKVAPKDFFSSMKDIEFLFIKASDSGKEVPRMLEANKLHFRPIFPGKESGSKASVFLKTCFSCGDDPSQIKEEPPQTSVKYLTWHRTTSSRSSSSGNPMGLNAKDDVEELTNNLFNNICMISGSHASTLDRLYAWERKLYDEVKASEAVRGVYDQKCRDLRQLESTGIRTDRIDKTRAVVKDLHSRIRVAIHRIDSISKRIEELRDKELQPQLEELIDGLSRMWEVMQECHKRQFEIISAAFSHRNMKISVQSESHRLITTYLEHELSSLSSSFTKWISAQESYMQSINSWLFKCVSIPQTTSRKKRRRRNNLPPLRNYGPPIYVTVGVWLERLEALPAKSVSDSIKGLASEISHYLPRQEKNHGKGISHLSSTIWKGDPNSDSNANLLRDDVSEDWNPGFDRFQTSLVKFLGQMNKFADSSVEMYADLDKAIKNAKNSYSVGPTHDPRAVPMS